MVGFGHGGNCGLRGGLACAQAVDNFKRHQSDSLIPRGDKFKKELTSVPQILIVMCILVYWYRMIFMLDQKWIGVTSSAVSDKSDKSDKPDKYWMISKKLL